MSNIFNQIGIFKLPAKLLRDDPQLFQKILSRVIVVSCEHDFPSDSFGYVAYSEDFLAVASQSLPYTYEADLEKGRLVMRSA